MFKKRRFAVLVCAVALSLGIVGSASAVEAGVTEVQPREMIETVMNTYRTFYGVTNVSMYNITYKNLTFKTSYTQTPSTLVSVEAATTSRPEYISGYGTFMIGSVEYWRCNYVTW
jgi:hypothetical protein